MNKNAIKVVKRNEKDGAQEAPVVVSASKAERNNQHKMVNMVNNWISERRENSRAEKVFSDGEILGWKIISENV
jgi:hypothetical protein